MSAHTPGPWEISLKGGHVWIIGDNHATVYDSAAPAEWPMSKDDARLIKAAPDLLKACTRAAELIGNWVDEPPLGVNNVFSELLAAIAAAKGRQA